ncbi:MAG: alpha-E domain-containing protein, partial [Caldilineaceae bacterium]|nr:alpha-E domain-containing protein [Caldilineaceae bacterium]
MVMLSRVADQLYWMSKYLERADYTARVVDLTLNLTLDQPPTLASRSWQRILLCLRVLPVTVARNAAIYADTQLFNDHNVTQMLTFDASNNDSVVACIASARNNARQVREQISSDMWQQLNQLYLTMRQTQMDQILDRPAPR